MELKIKWFDELTAREVYEIARSRTEVFLLEQEIICQDLDGIDYDSLHCFLEEDGRVVAYLRAFLAEDGTARIGRVLTLTHGQGLGRQLMTDAIPVIEDTWQGKRILLHAQTYAQGFYERFGFVTTSPEFIEDGIPHVEMVRESGGNETMNAKNFSAVVLFEQFVKGEKDFGDPEPRKEALTTKSYKKQYQKENKKELVGDKTNDELATYGDALLKFALTDILLDEGISGISEERKKYEGDKELVKVIAKHYDLLDIEDFKYDEEDEKIPKDYNYDDKQNQKGNNKQDKTHKYLATTMEALLGAYYKIRKNMDEMKDIVSYWKTLIDNEKAEGENTK